MSDQDDNKQDIAPSSASWLMWFGLIGISLILVGILFSWLYVTSILNRPAIFSDDQTVIIKPGSGRVVISAVLNKAGIEHPIWVMRLEEFNRGDAYVPKAGEFALPKGTSLKSAMDIIHQGASIQHQLTFPEGHTSRQIVDVINADKRLEGVITPLPAEGVLLPETYAFTRGAHRNQLIERMQQTQEIRFASLWAEKVEGLPFGTLEEAIILASIVEKETGLSGERAKVASVFINRLRAGMRLQSDPTVLYGLEQAGEKVDRLLRRHWDHNSPWNTYRVNGLPPTPICNPGTASLEAVLNPQETGYYYFVANGKGGHAFAKTLAEHNRNVKAWQRIKKSKSQ